MICCYFSLKVETFSRNLLVGVKFSILLILLEPLQNNDDL